MNNTIEIKVPDIGGFKDVAIIDILIAPGDTVAAEASLITIESDKAAMDIPCPQAGVVEKLLVKVGDKVSEGSPILMLAAALPSPASGGGAGGEGEVVAPASPNTPSPGPAGHPLPPPSPGASRHPLPQVGEGR